MASAAADDFKDPTTVPVTKDPDEVIKQPTTTQAEYGNDGNGDLIEAMNNDHKKKRKAEGEPDSVAVKQNKLAIDLNQVPPEEPRNMSDGLVTYEAGNSGTNRSEPIPVPVDLELRLGLGGRNKDIDLNEDPPESS